MLQFSVPSNVQFTLHATQRASQRGISRQAIAYALVYGKRTRRSDASRIELRRCDIRACDMAAMHKKAGLVVDFDEATREVITLYPRYDSHQRLSRRRGKRVVRCWSSTSPSARRPSSPLRHSRPGMGSKVYCPLPNSHAK